MKLLIITQKVDKDDSILGFFHRWIEEFAKHCESIIVICLEKGEYNLPNNVKVLSLGKPSQGWSASGRERFLGRLKALVNFYKYIWQERKNYDAVFVHMNQEYVLLGGILWLLLGKKVFMWRNHHAGNILTDVAATFCLKVFCTSPHSYTAKFKKTQIMPAGIDTGLFRMDRPQEKIKNSILYIGRITPVKNVDVLIDATVQMDKGGHDFTLTLVGDSLPKDAEYMAMIKTKAKPLIDEGKINFLGNVPNNKTTKIYNTHEVVVNLTDSGSFDKTILEAMACETLVLVSNENLKGEIPGMFLFREGSTTSLAEQWSALLALSTEEKRRYGAALRAFVERNHALTLLVARLTQAFDRI